MTITGTPPDCIGDIPSFSARFPAPADRPTASAGGMHVDVYRPDGTITNDDAGVTSIGTNAFLYVATFPIDQAGPWEWKARTSGELIDAEEFTARIRPSKFPAS